MRTLALVALVALAGGSVVAADCVPWRFDPWLTLDARPVATLYVHEDCMDQCAGLFSLWVYIESNGIEGLQRQDAVVDTTCGGLIPGDTILV